MRAKIDNLVNCCGLKEIGGFGSRIGNYYSENSRYNTVKKRTITESGFAYICVTRWSDVTYKAKLRAWGFKSVGRWKHPHTGRVLTRWAYLPTRQKKGT